MRRKRTSERCEGTSERTREWPSRFHDILNHGTSPPQVTDLIRNNPYLKKSGGRETGGRMCLPCGEQLFGLSNPLFKIAADALYGNVFLFHDKHRIRVRTGLRHSDSTFYNFCLLASSFPTREFTVSSEFSNL